MGQKYNLTRWTRPRGTAAAAENVTADESAGGMRSRSCFCGQGYGTDAVDVASIDLIARHGCMRTLLQMRLRRGEGKLGPLPDRGCRLPTGIASRESKGGYIGDTGGAPDTLGGETPSRQELRQGDA